MGSQSDLQNSGAEIDPCGAEKMIETHRYHVLRGYIHESDASFNMAQGLDTSNHQPLHMQSAGQQFFTFQPYRQVYSVQQFEGKEVVRLS